MGACLGVDISADDARHADVAQLGVGRVPPQQDVVGL